MSHIVYIVGGIIALILFLFGKYVGNDFYVISSMGVIGIITMYYTTIVGMNANRKDGV